MALSESSADGSPLLRARARLAGPSFGRARRGASLARQLGRRALLRGAAVGLLFAVWELAPRLGLVERTFLPPLSEVLSAGAALARSGQLWQHLRASGVRALAGLALALLYAVPLGLAIGWYRALAELLGPLIEVLRNTAALALLPVFILLLGIGETSKIALVTYACSWPILLSTVSAVRQVDPLLIRCARTLALSPPRLFARVILPAALPTIFAGIRLAAGNAVLVLIAAEMIGAKAGLGFLVINSQYSFQIPQMYVGILAITAVGLALNHVLLRVEARLSAWRPVGDARG